MEYSTLRLKPSLPWVKTTPGDAPAALLSVQQHCFLIRWTAELQQAFVLPADLNAGIGMCFRCNNYVESYHRVLKKVLLA
jgi:hypothetical protein